ncbi:MAG: hypothetical protein M0Q02_13360, partial [Candidatus Muirbacterium halophilum]|nr:hypothetical protein [Candidatus Muirbacterium halophilum]
WAILIEKDNTEKLYFVVETKGSELFENITQVEQAKIKCAKKHFEAIDEQIQMIGPIDTYQKLQDKL